MKDIRGFFRLKSIFDELEDFVFLNLLVWYKPNAMPSIKAKVIGQFWLSQEFMLFYKKKGEINYFDYQLAKDKNLIRGLFDYSKPNQKGHVSVKPIKLIKDLVEITSKKQDIVLDCFMGSGTTAVACKQLNRNFIGFEINEDYCRIANKRLEQENINKW